MPQTRTMAPHGGGTRAALVTAAVVVLCLVTRCSAEEYRNRTRRQAVSDGGRTINTGYYSEWRTMRRHQVLSAESEVCGPEGCPSLCVSPGNLVFLLICRQNIN